MVTDSSLCSSENSPGVLSGLGRRPGFSSIRVCRRHAYYSYEDESGGRDGRPVSIIAVWAKAMYYSE